MPAFPMKETSDVSNEFKFEHVLILACVFENDDGLGSDGGTIWESYCRF